MKSEGQDLSPEVMQGLGGGFDLIHPLSTGLLSSMSVNADVRDGIESGWARFRASQTRPASGMALTNPTQPKPGPKPVWVG